MKDLPATQDGIDQIEGDLLAMPQIDCPVTHHFGPGVYIRECAMPAGSLVIGHAHKGPCLNVLVKGSMRVITPEGQPRTITAPLIFTSGPGRKAAYVIEDVVFQNIHATDETDLDKLEDLLIDKSAAWIAHHEIAALTAETEV